MNIVFDLDINLIGTKTLLHNLGIYEGGETQKFFSNEIMRRSDKRVPMDSAILKNSAMLDAGSEGILYVTPYARYHWFGKLMIDSVTGSSYARPYTQKILTDRNMNYQGSPLRGPFWVDRTWIDEGNDIVKETEKFIERNFLK